MNVIETRSAEQTFDLAEKMGETCDPGTIIALCGDLGTGKTVFAKGFAAGLGIKSHVSSPTYTIVQQYDEGRLPFFHFDVYRISDLSEMDETGYEDSFFGKGAVLVEWAEIIREIMPPGTLWITLEKDPEKGFDYRKVTIRDEYSGN